MYVTSLKKQQIAFITNGPKAPNLIGGKKAQCLITTLNLVLGTVTLACVGVHVGAMYDVQPGEFNWIDPSMLRKATNASGSVAGALVSGGPPGTLITPVPITDPNFCSAFMPLG